VIALVVCAAAKGNLESRRAFAAKPQMITDSLPAERPSEGNVCVLRVGFEESLQFLQAGGVAHFPQGFGFDLPNSFAGDVELATEPQGVAITVGEAETHVKHILFLGTESGQAFF
jgi:hypothetical protein